jgi:hypothetical protein
MFLRNVRTHQQIHTALHPRKPPSTGHDSLCVRTNYNQVFREIHWHIRESKGLAVRKTGIITFSRRKTVSLFMWRTARWIAVKSAVEDATVVRAGTAHCRVSWCTVSSTSSPFFVLGSWTSPYARTGNCLDRFSWEPLSGGATLPTDELRNKAASQLPYIFQFECRYNRS